VQGVVDFGNRLPPPSSEERKKEEGIMMNPRSKFRSTVLFNKFEILLSEYHCQKKSGASIYFGQVTFFFLSLGENPRFYIHTHRPQAEWTYICPSAAVPQKREAYIVAECCTHFPQLLAGERKKKVKLVIKIGTELKGILNKYAHICSGFFLTPSPTQWPPIRELHVC